uniref:Uncharacterized protein n=1 Tax=Gasterosteus aculeatus TaxID=69293 RepID=G3PBI9_GASAC
DFLNVEELVSIFDATCTEILNSVAPLREKRRKPQKEPWLNVNTRSLRRACRTAERKWKKDKLQVSLQILKDLLHKYQGAVKSAKTHYLSHLVASNTQRPQVLFKVFNSLINPCENDCAVPSTLLCENFLKHFIDKI